MQTQAQQHTIQQFVHNINKENTQEQSKNIILTAEKKSITNQ